MIDRRIFAPLSGAIFVVILVGGLVYWANFRTPDVPASFTPEERFKSGLDSVAANDLGAAEVALSELDSAPGYRDQARVLRAALALKRNAAQEAVNELAQMPADEEIREIAALLLAEAFHQLGDLANAQKAADFVVKTRPENPAGHRRLAAVYYDLGANANAVAELREVIKLVPDDFRPHYLMGQIAFDGENYQEAVSSLQSALERNPSPTQKTEIVLQLAQSLLKTHQYERAVRLLDQYADGNAAFLALESEAQWALGNTMLAKEHLGTAERIEPKNRFLLLQKSRIAIHEGHTEAAIPALEKLLAADPHDTESRYQLAMCFRKLGMTDRSQAEFKLHDESQALKRQLADLSDEATKQPTNAEVRDRLALLFEKLGRPEIAATYRRAADACRRIQK